MKKIYSLLIAGILTYSGTLSAQTDAQRVSKTLSAAEKAQILSEVQPSSNDRGGVVLECNDSLWAEYQGGNGYQGVMFDMVVLQDMYLETFSVSMDAGTWNVAVFMKSGTFVGNETSAASWTFLDSAVIVSTTTDDTVFYRVPLALNQHLTPGTYGFYVTGTSPSAPMNYTDGTGVGNIFSQDAYIQIKEGNGGSYPFGVTFSPRVFNGVAHYCLNVTSVEEVNQSELLVYPNPATDLLSVDLTSFGGKNVAVSLVNAVGQVVYTTSTGTTNATIDVSHFANGIYVLRAEVDGSVVNTKVVIE